MKAFLPSGRPDIDGGQAAPSSVLDGAFFPDKALLDWILGILPSPPQPAGSDLLKVT
ncbi:hypothetical protein N9F76_01140 [bacterium]|nr:hypothetical protein [bacterium]MDB4730394.1 hypothetical protein [bacterium]